MSLMSSHLRKYNVDDDETGNMLYEEMRSLNKSSQAHKRELTADSESDRKNFKWHDQDSLKKKIENYSKKFQMLENLIIEAIKNKPDYVQMKIEGLKIDMDIIKIQLARLKFYQLLGLAFVLVSLVVGCMIYKKIVEEDYKMCGKIYREVPIDIP